MVPETHKREIVGNIRLDSKGLSTLCCTFCELVNYVRAFTLDTTLPYIWSAVIGSGFNKSTSVYVYLL